jgi:hypothetical protein
MTLLSHRGDPAPGAMLAVPFDTPKTFELRVS